MVSLLPLLLATGFILGGPAPSRPAPHAKVARVKVTRVRPVRRAPAKPRPVKRAPQVALPGAVDDTSLGFGSTPERVQRLLGKPTRVAKGMNGSVWFYSLSSITIGKGKVVAWSTYDRPLSMNIGAPQPGAPAPKLGSTVRQVVAARGTPNTVAMQGATQVWFYGRSAYTLRGGRVVPTDYGAPGAVTMPAAKPPPGGKVAPGAPAGRARCHCPL